MSKLILSTSFLLITMKDVLAQAATQPEQNPVMQFVPMLLVFAIFYFLMIRPQKKKLETETKMLSSLAKGDDVYTKSGMLGTISGMTDKIITLEVAEGTKLKMLKTHVAGLSAPLFEKKAESKK